MRVFAALALCAALLRGQAPAGAVASPSSALLARGVAARKAGQTVEAIRLLRQALAGAPREIEGQARLELLRIFERRGQWWEAAGELRELRRLAPTEAEYAYQLGVAYRNLAKSSYEQLRGVAPESARYQQLLGEQLSAAGETRKAIEAFQRAISADPKLPGPHLALAVVYLRMNKRNDALAEIERELAIAPASAAAGQIRQAIIGATK